MIYTYLIHGDSLSLGIILPWINNNGLHVPATFKLQSKLTHTCSKFAGVTLLFALPTFVLIQNVDSSRPAQTELSSDNLSCSQVDASRQRLQVEPQAGDRVWWGTGQGDLWSWLKFQFGKSMEILISTIGEVLITWSFDLLVMSQLESSAREELCWAAPVRVCESRSWCLGSKGTWTEFRGTNWASVAA